jgi:hypothetical protein
MIEHLLHPRIIESKDWATILFVLAFAIVAITKSVYENRFGDFMNLIFSDKYAKLYRDGHLKAASPFPCFVQVISFAFFIQLSFSFLGTAQRRFNTLHSDNYIFNFLRFI